MVKSLREVIESGREFRLESQRKVNGRVIHVLDLEVSARMSQKALHNEIVNQAPPNAEAYTKPIELFRNTIWVTYRVKYLDKFKEIEVID